eukprot:scaffold28631_cov72-Skeletonema_dohrnii-CCMP3373.AAC.1
MDSMDSTTLRQRERADLEPLLHEEGNNAGVDDESHHHYEHTKATHCSNFSPGSISNLCSATLGA